MHFIGNHAIVLGHGLPEYQLVYSPGYTVLSVFLPIFGLTIAFSTAELHVKHWYIHCMALFLTGVFAGLSIVRYVDPGPPHFGCMTTDVPVKHALSGQLGCHKLQAQIQRSVPRRVRSHRDRGLPGSPGTILPSQRKMDQLVVEARRMRFDIGWRHFGHALHCLLSLRVRVPALQYPIRNQKSRQPNYHFRRMLRYSCAHGPGSACARPRSDSATEKQVAEDYARMCNVRS